MLNTLYGTGGSLVSSTFGAKVSGTAAAGISQILSANFTKAEGLAFIFAISFNMPCVSALAATARETHSVKWSAKIGVFYTLAISADRLCRVSYRAACLLSAALIKKSRLEKETASVHKSRCRLFRCQKPSMLQTAFILSCIPFRRDTHKTARADAASHPELSWHGGT